MEYESTTKIHWDFLNQPSCHDDSFWNLCWWVSPKGLWLNQYIWGSMLDDSLYCISMAGINNEILICHLIFSIFRFVLYQLSKNLNRPFFMDFLTQLSIRYTEKSAVLDEEDPEDQGWFQSKILLWICFLNLMFITYLQEIILSLCSWSQATLLKRVKRYKVNQFYLWKLFDSWNIHMRILLSFPRNIVIVNLYET